MYMCQKKIFKKRILFLSFLKIFLSFGRWPNFLATLKIHNKFKLDWNQLKVDLQHKDMFVYQKKL